MISNTAWIGYHDRAEEAGCTDDRHQGIGGEIAATTFVWTDGTASDYENWAAREELMGSAQERLPRGLYLRV